jgi:hypothetical protein
MWLEMHIKISKKYITKALPVLVVPRGIQVIHRMLQLGVHQAATGRIQWLESEKKISKKSSQILTVPTVPRGYQVIHKFLQSQVQQAAAGSSPVAS